MNIPRFPGSSNQVASGYLPQRLIGVAHAARRQQVESQNQGNCQTLSSQQAGPSAASNTASNGGKISRD